MRALRIFGVAVAACWAGATGRASVTAPGAPPATPPPAARGAADAAPPTAETTSGPPAAPLSMSAQGVEDISVDADHFESNEDATVVLATGNVRAVITRKDEKGQPSYTTVWADIVSADLVKKVLTAEGHVAVDSQGYVARGQRVEYHWQEQAGTVESASTHAYGLTFQAGRIHYTPVRQTIQDAIFSACGLDNPEYVLKARRVDITPNRRIVAHHVTLYMYHHRIIGLPVLVYRLRRGRAQSGAGFPVARPGYSEVSGFFIRQPLPFGPGIDAEVEPSTRAGIKGRFRFEPDAPIAPYLNIELRQEHGVRGRDPVLVSRLPQAGVLFGRDHSLDISAEYDRERPTHVNAGRMTAAWNHTVLDRGSRPGFNLRGGLRASHYTTGDTYGTGNVELSVGKGGPDTRADVGVRLNGIAGHSPFLWDQVQVQTELFGAKRLPWKQYRFETAIRYDLGRHEVYDFQVGFAKQLRCLEPEILYSTRRRFLMLRIRAVGFGDAEPNTDEAPAALTPPPDEG